MNLRTRIFAIVGALMLVGGTAATTLAQAVPTDTGNATVSITSDATVNYLAVSISDASFTPKPYSFTDQSTSGALTVTVTDTRGTAAGWNVNLDATDFGSGGGSFSISNLSLTAGAVAGALFQDATASALGITASNASPVKKTGVSTTKVLSAAVASGAGLFNLPMTGSLNIPGGTLVGTYTSTVTVSIASGP